MSTAHIKLPFVAEVEDYHEFGSIINMLSPLLVLDAPSDANPHIKSKKLAKLDYVEVGCSGNYFAVIYSPQKEGRAWKNTDAEPFEAFLDHCQNEYEQKNSKKKNFIVGSLLSEKIFVETMINFDFEEKEAKFIYQGWKAKREHQELDTSTQDVPRQRRRMTL